MLSTVVTISEMEHSGQDAVACSPPNPNPAGLTLQPHAPNLQCWSHFHKPILAILVGGLLFGSGTALSLLYFIQMGNVPYLLGPLLLSVGLMFLVTGLVWVPVVKQSLEHMALTKVSDGKGSQLEQQQHL